MKKLVQSVIITAAAFVIGGFGLLTVGRIMGGESSFWIRDHRLYTNQDIRKEQAGRMVVLEKTELDAFHSMDVRIDYNNIVVKPSEDGRCYLEYRLYTQKTEPEYHVKDGVLTVTCTADSSKQSTTGHVGFFMVNTNLKHEIGQATIYVPKQASMDLVKLYNKDGTVTYDGPAAETLNITSKFGSIALIKPEAKSAVMTLSDGSVSCTGGQFTDLTLINKFGSTELNDLTASKIDIQISDGSLSMNRIETSSLTADNKYGSVSCDTITADTLTIRQNDGSCTFKNATVKNGWLENKFGNITLNLTGRERDYNYDLNTKHGETDINGHTFEEHNLSINNGAVNNIVTKSNDGSVVIRTR